MIHIDSPKCWNCNEHLIKREPYIPYYHCDNDKFEINFYGDKITIDFFAIRNNYFCISISNRKIKIYTIFNEKVNQFIIDEFIENYKDNFESFIKTKCESILIFS